MDDKCDICGLANMCDTCKDDKTCKFHYLVCRPTAGERVLAYVEFLQKEYPNQKGVSLSLLSTRPMTDGKEHNIRIFDPVCGCAVCAVKVAYQYTVRRYFTNNIIYHLCTVCNEKKLELCLDTGKVTTICKAESHEVHIKLMILWNGMKEIFGQIADLSYRLLPCGLH